MWLHFNRVGTSQVDRVSSFHQLDYSLPCERLEVLFAHHREVVAQLFSDHDEIDERRRQENKVDENINRQLDLHRVDKDRERILMRQHSLLTRFTFSALSAHFLVQIGGGLAIEQLLQVHVHFLVIVLHDAVDRGVLQQRALLLRLAKDQIFHDFIDDARLHVRVGVILLEVGQSCLVVDVFLSRLDSDDFGDQRRILQVVLHVLLDRVQNVAHFLSFARVQIRETLKEVLQLHRVAKRIQI
jgi:hypothetical protein